MYKNILVEVAKYVKCFHELMIEHLKNKSRIIDFLCKIIYFTDIKELSIFLTTKLNFISYVMLLQFPYILIL